MKAKSKFLRDFAFWAIVATLVTLIFVMMGLLANLPSIRSSPKLYESVPLADFTAVAQDDNIVSSKLVMDRRELSTTTFRTKFARTELEERCENFFGYQMIHNARASKQQTCSPPQGANIEDGLEGNAVKSSAMHCYKMHTTPGDDLFCEGDNLQIAFDSLTAPNPEWYAYNGAVRGVCDKDKRFFGNPKAFRFANGDYYNNFVTSSDPLQCGTVIEGPVLVVTRDGEKNLAFALTDFVNAFVVLETTGLLEHPDLRVLIMDQAPQGPFVSLWKELFSPNHEVLWAKEFFSKNGGPGSVCFKKLVFALPGPLGFLNINVREPHICSDSELLESFSRYAAQSLKLTSAPGASDLVRPRPRGIIAAPKKVPTVTFIVRHNYTTAEGINRPIGRQWRNEAAMIDYLRAFEPMIRIKVIDLAQISIREQIETMRISNALIGAHGAGMAHVLFLPKESVVLEMFPRRVDSMRYRNWSKFAPASIYLGWTNQKQENNFPRPDVRPKMGYWDADMLIDENEWKTLVNEVMRVVSGFLDGHGKN